MSNQWNLANPLQIKETTWFSDWLTLEIWPLDINIWYTTLSIKNAINNWSIKLNLLIRFKRTLIIITLIFWIFNQKFQLGPQPETLINNIINIWSLSTLYSLYLSIISPFFTYHALILLLSIFFPFFPLSHLYIPFRGGRGRATLRIRGG